MTDMGRVGEGVWPHWEQICSGQPPVLFLPGGGGGWVGQLHCAGEHAWEIIHKNFPQHCGLLGVSSCNFLHPQTCHFQGQEQGIDAAERRDVEHVSMLPYFSVGCGERISAHPGPRLLVISLGRPLCFSARSCGGASLSAADSGPWLPSALRYSVLSIQGARGRIQPSSDHLAKPFPAGPAPPIGSQGWITSVEVAGPSFDLCELAAQGVGQGEATAGEGGQGECGCTLAPPQGAAGAPPYTALLLVPAPLSAPQPWNEKACHGRLSPPIYIVS